MNSFSNLVMGYTPHHHEQVPDLEISLWASTFLPQLREWIHTSGGQDGYKSQISLVSVVISAASGMPWSAEDLGCCKACAPPDPATTLNIALHKDSDDCHIRSRKLLYCSSLDQHGAMGLIFFLQMLPISELYLQNCWAIVMCYHLWCAAQDPTKRNC